MFLVPHTSGKVPGPNAARLKRSHRIVVLMIKSMHVWLLQGVPGLHNLLTHKLGAVPHTLRA